MLHFLSLFWILCLVLCAVSIRPQYLRCMFEPDLGPDPDYRSRGFCGFCSDPDPESKICEKPDPESLFNFGIGRSLCGHLSGKNMDELQLE